MEWLGYDTALPTEKLQRCECLPELVNASDALPRTGLEIELLQRLSLPVAVTQQPLRVRPDKWLFHHMRPTAPPPNARPARGR